MYLGVLKKMRKLPEEYPEIYKHSREERFLVKTNIGYFKSGAPDKSKDFRNQKSIWYFVKRDTLDCSLLESRNVSELSKYIDFTEKATWHIRILIL